MITEELVAANPWGMPALQFETLAVLIEAGDSKSAARQMGTEAKTVEKRSQMARAKMAAHYKKRITRLQAAVLLDRYIHGRGVQA